MSQNCYNTGARVPRENIHDQNERLTTKHIQTLSFVQEIVNENKGLKSKIDDLEGQLAGCADLHALAEQSKTRIQQIQDQYMKRADEINALMAERHKAEIMEKVEEKLIAEKLWEDQKRELKDMIERLEKENKSLQEELSKLTTQDVDVQSLQEELKAVQKELEEVKEERDRLKQENTNQMKELQKMQGIQDYNQVLEQQLNEAQQKVKEMTFRVEKLEKELEEQANNSNQDELMNALRNKLAKLHKEKSTFTEKEEEYKKIIKELREEIEKLRRALGDSERMRGDLQHDRDMLVQEITVLQQQNNPKDKKTFRDFVQLKREFNALKVENEELRQKIKFKPGALPSLKGDGPPKRTSSAKMERKGSVDIDTHALTWK